MVREQDELDDAQPELRDDAGAAGKQSNAKEDRHFVTALARGLDILSCFRSGEKLLATRNWPNAPGCQSPPSRA